MSSKEVDDLLKMYVFFNSSDLQEMHFSYKDGDREMAVKFVRTLQNIDQIHHNTPSQQTSSRTPSHSSNSSENRFQTSVNQASSQTPSQATDKIKTITSPMVGTIYLSPSPDKPRFIEKGTTFKKGSVLFLIEAMKVMNEVKAEHDGTVKNILVENACVVEYGEVIIEWE
jgi:acetyl-CoA carboxylase biotin carboxyl carrier protein